MNSFVILFRRRGPALTDSDRQRLNAETAAWAKTSNAAGHELDPRILSAERAFHGSDSAAAQAEVQIVSALLFLQADDFDAAVRVAEAHPGLRYGFNVEVRPWATPAVATTPSLALPRTQTVCEPSISARRSRAPSSAIPADSHLTDSGPVVGVSRARELPKSV